MTDSSVRNRILNVCIVRVKYGTILIQYLNDIVTISRKKSFHLNRLLG